MTNTYLCELSASSDNLSDLPIIKKMSDNGDGTYSTDYVLTQTGSVTVSVELMSKSG